MREHVSFPWGGAPTDISTIVGDMLETTRKVVRMIQGPVRVPPERWLGCGHFSAVALFAKLVHWSRGTIGTAMKLPSDRYRKRLKPMMVS